MAVILRGERPCVLQHYTVTSSIDRLQLLWRGGGTTRQTWVAEGGGHSLTDILHSSRLQTFNNYESIGIKVYRPDIDSDVAASAIKMSNFSFFFHFN